jgi:pilus assembly protein Flp/PilA
MSPYRRPKFLPERNTMKKLLIRLWKDEEGQDLTEYALLLVLLSLAAVGALSGLAVAINGTFTNASTKLT